MSKIQQPNLNYSRRSMYMPGNTALKKSKYDIDTDYNPITNGTIQQNSHLCAISVKSLKQCNQTKNKIYRKEKLGKHISLVKFEKQKDQKNMQTSYQQFFNQTQSIKKNLRPNTAQNIKKTNFQVKSQKKFDQNNTLEQLNAYNKLQTQIQSLKVAQNIQTLQFQNQGQKIDQECKIEEIDKLDTQDDNNEDEQMKQSDIISTSSKIDQILKQHPDYYNHLSGKCKCFTCTCLQNCQCNFKKMLIKFSPNYKSVYNTFYSDQINETKNHFNEQHNKLVENCLKTDLLNLNCQANVQAKSQAGFDYNDHGPQEKLQNQKPCQMIKSFSSQQLTHYKYNFSQNPTYQKVQFKDMSLQPLLSKEPLQKSSLYQDNFQKKQKKQDIEIMNNALVKRTPYSEVLSFGHNTQNRQTYQGQQVYDKTNLVYQSDHLANLNSINHYQATSQDYGKVQSLRCE